MISKKTTLRAGTARRSVLKDPIAIMLIVFVCFGMLTFYIFMVTNVTEHESLLASDSVKSSVSRTTTARSRSSPASVAVHPTGQSLYRPPVVPEKTSFTGLETLKQKAGTRVVTNPVTKRQQLSAFGSDWNSSRFEPISCPDHPESGYPKTYDMKSILDNWNPDDTDIPPFHYNSLCYFDFQTELDKATNYRNAEVPFVVYNHPEVDAVVERWSDLNFMNEKIGPTKKYKTTTAKDNHFMYFSANKKSRKNADWVDQKGNPWTPPTSNVDMTFEQWLNMAVDNHNISLPDRKHFYFRVSTQGSSHWIFNELPFFQPKPNFFMVDPSGQRGIHCRFGMRSVISENHWDGSRNFAATFGGVRRWILNHPNQCSNLYMFKTGHPSARHSMIDWSEPDYVKYPNFATAESNEAVMRPGDVLYLPTNWFHYIISLNINIQCNTRSGRTANYDAYVKGSQCNL